LIFFGENPESIDLFRTLAFHEKELRLRPDWARLKNYRAFLFISPEG
jgi:hypothetical protein